MDKKYLKVYNDIVSKIESGVYEPTTMLPSEKNLINHYQVSRDTVRKSLSMLEQNGYIQKTKGKGSFVLDINKLNFPVSGVVSFKEVTERSGRNAKTKVELFESQFPRESIRKNLELNSDEPVWKVVRSRTIDNEKVILDKDYLVQKYVPHLTEEVCQIHYMNILRILLD